MVAFYCLFIIFVSQDPGKLRTAAKIAAKDTWLDSKKAGMIYSHPARKSSTPGDAYSNISQENIQVNSDHH